MSWVSYFKNCILYAVVILGNLYTVNQPKINQSITKGTMEPEIDSMTWIKFSNNMALCALVANSGTRWHNLHWFKIWSLGGTICIVCKVGHKVASRVAEVEGARERRSPKGQGLLRKEGPPTYAILSRNLVLSRFTRFLKGFHRAFN